MLLCRCALPMSSKTDNCACRCVRALSLFLAVVLSVCLPLFPYTLCRSSPRCCGPMIPRPRRRATTFCVCTCWCIGPQTPSPTAPPALSYARGPRTCTPACLCVHVYVYVCLVRACQPVHVCVCMGIGRMVAVMGRMQGRRSNDSVCLSALVSLSLSLLFMCMGAQIATGNWVYLCDERLGAHMEETRVRLHARAHHDPRRHRHHHDSHKHTYTRT
jgi:hypothetical protein